MDRVLMQVIFSLAKAGYPQYIDDIKECIRFGRDLIPGMSLVPAAVCCYSGSRGKVFSFSSFNNTNVTKNRRVCTPLLNT